MARVLERPPDPQGRLGRTTSGVYRIYQDPGQINYTSKFIPVTPNTIPHILLPLLPCRVNYLRAD